MPLATYADGTGGMYVAVEGGTVPVHSDAVERAVACPGADCLVAVYVGHRMRLGEGSVWERPPRPADPVFVGLGDLAEDGSLRLGIGRPYRLSDLYDGRVVAHPWPDPPPAWIEWSADQVAVLLARRRASRRVRTPPGRNVRAVT